MVEVRRFLLEANDWIPNNSRLPVLLYRNALDPDATGRLPAFRTMFRRNGWIPDWDGRLHSEHQFHASAHEVIGFAEGSGIIMIGGPAGKKIAVDAGDAIMLPAGTGHCVVQESWDFKAIGAYPEGQRWDVHRAAPSRDVLIQIGELPMPPSDPVLGNQIGY
jgi:uncharacterized protein YjlB